MAKLCQFCLIRSTRGDTAVTFGRFFHFLHTKSEIPKFQLNPTPDPTLGSAEIIFRVIFHFIFHFSFSYLNMSLYLYGSSDHHITRTLGVTQRSQ